MRVIILAMALAGCATKSEPIIIREPIEVKTTVLEVCVQEVPPAPALISDQELAGLRDYPAVKALERDRLQRQAYEAKLRAVLERCAARQFDSPAAETHTSPR